MERFISVQCIVMALLNILYCRQIYLHTENWIVLRVKCYKAVLTVLKERIAKRFAIMVLNPGARQDCAMKPSLSSARQITSSPCFQSQLGMFKR